MPNILMPKLTLPAVSLRVSLVIYGFVMAVSPLCIFVFTKQNVPELDELSIVAFAILSAFIIGTISMFLIYRPFRQLYLSTCATLKLKNKSVAGFSARSFKANLDMISKMAVLGHESIKGFRALPTPAILFDRNGIIISQSAGLSSMLTNEFPKVKSNNGTLFFIGEHISTIMGADKTQYLQKFQDVPLIIKDTQTIKITATLSRINDGSARKEAGLILFGIDYKVEAAKAIHLNNESYAPNEAAEIIQELKSTCITITNSFSVISNFMRNMADGNFEHRISLDSKGEIGKLVHVANGFAQNLQQLSTLFAPRLANAQQHMEFIHKEADELLASSALTQQSFAQTYKHFTTSTISDTKLGELFSQLNEAVNLMDVGTQTAHNSVIKTVNQSTKISQQLQNIHQFTTLVEDLGFHLKLLGLTASVEAAKHNHSETLQELCRDIRALGEKFRNTGSEFRAWIVPLDELAQDSTHNMVVAQNALVQLSPLSQKVAAHIQSQEHLVKSALLPRTEAANTIEQALRHSNAVHQNLLNASSQIQILSSEIRDLFEISSAIIPSKASFENAQNTLKNTQDLPAVLDKDISLDWFERDLLLRELSGDAEIAIPQTISNHEISHKPLQRKA